MLNKLMDEGMNVARLNLSHANPEVFLNFFFFSFNNFFSSLVLSNCD